VCKILKAQGYEIPQNSKLNGRVAGEKIDSDPKDTLLFYFLGHGIPDGYANGYLFSELES
jgi:hypothetical protein